MRKTCTCDKKLYNIRCEVHDAKHRGKRIDEAGQLSPHWVRACVGNDRYERLLRYMAMKGGACGK